MRTLLVAGVVLASLGPPLAAQREFAMSKLGGGFLDLSTHLANRDTVVVVGTLEKLKDGKRERLKEGTDLGGTGTSVQVSGTVYYRVQATFVPKVDETLSGEPWKAGTTVRCELQAATLPSGDQQRRFRTGTRATAADGTRALFVLKKDKKGIDVVDVLAADPAIDQGDLAASFGKRAGDVFAVSKRMQALREACEAADRLAAKPEGIKPESLAPLRAVLDAAVELREPSHESWVTMHCGPLERALRGKLEKLAPK